MHRLPELKNVCAELSEDGSILLADTKIWLVPAEQKDRPYIISTWIRSYQRIVAKLQVGTQYRFMRKVDNDAYFRSYVPIVESYADRALVFRTEDGEACHGYIVSEAGQGDVRPCLHYVYIPPELRNLSLAKTAIQATCGAGPLDYSNYWPHPPPKHWTYNPYRFR